MNKLTLFFLTLLLASIPMGSRAQESEEQDDSNYLAGAVPEENGRVVFSQEFVIHNMSQQQIFERTQKWLAERLKRNENAESRVVYTEAEEGVIVGVGEEWVVFKSSALSLDRTQMSYQVSISCQPEKCRVKLEKIRYLYRDKEKYSAEEWITDKYALNKAGTKLVRGLAKWRRKTVDFANELFTEAEKALSASAQAAPVEKSSERGTAATGPVVIGVSSPSTVVKPTVQVVVPAPAASASAGEIPGFEAIAPDQIPSDVIQAGNGKWVIAIGSDPFNMTLMSANAGGSLGQISEKPVVFTILSPDQPYASLEKATSYSVRFYVGNQTEPSILLECKKLPASTHLEGQPRIYVGEIVKAWKKTN